MTNTKLVKLGKKGWIVIPKLLRERMGIKEGDLLLITAESDQISIISPEKYAKATRGLLKGLWGDSPEKVKAYLERERNSWA